MIFSRKKKALEPKPQNQSTANQKFLEHAEECTHCQGHGYLDIDPISGKEMIPMMPWGSNQVRQVGCKNCKGTLKSRGSGKIFIKLYKSDELCIACMGKGVINKEEIKESEENGMPIRKKEVWQEPCPACLGTKKKLHLLSYAKCVSCNGTGKVIGWTKSAIPPQKPGKRKLTSLEVIAEKVCPDCQGKKGSYRIESFAWKHEYSEKYLANSVDFDDLTKYPSSTPSLL